MSRLMLTIPLSPGRAAYLDTAGLETGADWDQMLRVVEAMRPGLIVPDGVPFCRHGHPQTLANTYGKAGGRRCRLCNREYQRRFDLRKYGKRRPHRGEE